jgi:hypothetical protein
MRSGKRLTVSKISIQCIDNGDLLGGKGKKLRETSTEDHANMEQKQRHTRTVILTLDRSSLSLFRTTGIPCRTVHERMT